MLTYCIQVLLFQILFLAIYDLFLAKETFFKKNRIYLILTPIISFVLPFLKISELEKTVSQDFMILLPEVVLSPQKLIETTEWYQQISYGSSIYYFGIVLFIVLFLMKLYKIIQLIYSYKKTKSKEYTLVQLQSEQFTFSFFRFIFLQKDLPEDKKEKVIHHELIHCRQMHTIDLLFFELLKIVMWFNPLLYLYQKRIGLVHEFLTDDEVVKTTEKKQYVNTILSDLFQVEYIPFVSHFYKKSLIKKRILMMKKSKSKKIQQLKYLLLIPVLMGMLLYTSCNKEVEVESSMAKKEAFTVYLNFGKSVLKQTSEQQTYMDRYFGDEEPSWKKISFSDLNELEKEEYEHFIQKLKSKNEEVKTPEYSFYQTDSDRKVFAHIIKIKFNYLSQTSNGDDVPFSIIEEVPVYPGCTGTREELAACLGKSIKKNILREFNAELVSELGISKGRKKIYVIFKIDKNGTITDVNARAPHPKLKAEAIRVVKLLPKMIPGKQRGKNVGMKYTLPISFNVE